MNKLKLFCLALLLTFASLHATMTEYNVKAMGLKVAYISFTKSDSQLLIKTHSLSKSILFPPIDNEYRIDVDEQFHPLLYIRDIKQKNLVDKIRVEYNRPLTKATELRKSNGRVQNYAIDADSRDVFSLIAYLTYTNPSKRQYVLDANGCPWMAKVSLPTREVVKTSLGKYNTNHYEITFKPLTSKETPYVDMITFNFVNEDTKLDLWVSDNHVAVKAVVHKKALAMSWEIIGHTP
ncbi:hypothetical protein MASR2M64_15000 [Candidatus Cloacimonadota bacterium]|nr:DUF3108 domain-containing protein [Candidatus Cloacimonadota bacterium]